MLSGFRKQRAAWSVRPALQYAGLSPQARRSTSHRHGAGAARMNGAPGPALILELASDED
jgi:hypothetical protein